MDTYIIPQISADTSSERANNSSKIWDKGSEIIITTITKLFTITSQEREQATNRLLPYLYLQPVKTDLYEIHQQAEDPIFSRRSPQSASRSRKQLQHPTPEWKPDRRLAPPNGRNIMKEGIPQDPTSTRKWHAIIWQEKESTFVIIKSPHRNTDFYNGHPATPNISAAP